MTSVHNYTSTQPFAKPSVNGGYASSVNGRTAAGTPRKNSMMMSGAQPPVLSSFAIDLIAQFDAYRTNMRETLRREVEENMQKAKALKEALKDASGFEAEQALQREQEELEREELLARVKALGSQTSLDSDKSGHNSNKSGKSLNLKGVITGSSAQSHHTTTTTSGQPEKKSKLERLFGKRAFSTSSAKSATILPGSTANGVNGNTPRTLKDQTQANSNGSMTLANNSSTDLADLRYLPVDEDNEEMYIDEVEIHIHDRSMNTTGAGVGGANHLEAAEPETQVKLHPTRAKLFSLPKSLRKLKRRIAALRAKGVDVGKDQQDASGEEQADKKKFRLIRLLPWKSSASPSKKSVTPTTTTTTAAHSARA